MEFLILRIHGYDKTVFESFGVGSRTLAKDNSFMEEASCTLADELNVGI